MYYKTQSAISSTNCKKGFNKIQNCEFYELGGLATTLNIFQEHVMLVRALNSNHTLIFLIPKNADMSKTIQMVNATKSEK